MMSNEHRQRPPQAAAGHLVNGTERLHPPPGYALFFDLGLALTALVAGGFALVYLLALPVPALALSLMTFGAIALPVLWYAPAAHRSGLGAANRVTLARGLLVAWIAGMLAAVPPSDTQAWGLVGLAFVALLLDGVDGWIARRRADVTAFGARFDMELDALLIALLALLLWLTGKVGPWVMFIGVLRYAFVACGALVPALRVELPPSRRRQAVCVLQVAVLIICLAPLTASGPATALAAATLALLGLSFAADIRWLLRPTPRAQPEG